MIKGPVLNLWFIQVSVFQDRPNRGRKICSKEVKKSYNMVKTNESRVPPSPTLDKVNVGFDKLIDNRAHGHYTLVGSPA